LALSLVDVGLTTLLKTHLTITSNDDEMVVESGGETAANNSSDVNSYVGDNRRQCRRR